jgi:hypothetical protein
LAEKNFKKLKKEEIMEYLKLITQVPALKAINSELITYFCMFNFHKFKTKFRCDPDNLLIYQAFQALLDKSIVELSESIFKWSSIYKIDLDSIFESHHWSLKNVRDIISHPANSVNDFDNEDLKKYINENKYNENKLQEVLKLLNCIYIEKELIEMLFIEDRYDVISYIQNILLSSINKSSSDLLSIYQDTEIIKENYKNFSLRYFEEIIKSINKEVKNLK